MRRCFCACVPLNYFIDTLRNAVSVPGCPIRHWHMQMLSGFIETPVGVQVAGCAQSALAYSVTELVCTHLEKCSFCAGGSYASPPTQQCCHKFCLGEGEEHQTYCRTGGLRKLNAWLLLSCTMLYGRARQWDHQLQLSRSWAPRESTQTIASGP